MLALTAYAVLAGATSLLAVGEWMTDAPPSVLERLGACWAASTATHWTGRWAAGWAAGSPRPAQAPRNSVTGPGSAG
ncbi:hypothetical protein ABZ864_24280 [Streptomyces sp. NPDC047082]|uniref:hypothetical protein n=1 Tax=Streptomyces sp. NPDC047082 TaxID=3155259 RepID=UPI003406D8FF